MWKRKSFLDRSYMLNENKVKMMTKMSIYEKNDGKTMLKTAKYFKGDYVSLGVLKTVIAATLAFVIIVLLFVLCQADSLTVNVNSIDYASMGKSIAGYYVAFIILFGIISGVVYSSKYESSRKEMKKYFLRLNKLERFYNVQKKKN